ncbi:Yeh1 protein [Candida orthopsilosis Co 90-125]|uniref:Yeh1 protein n=1 Tax=Candida orthopsilosis (strain 90-125) TaxID=1136231 RepID=H8WZY4_CANO9|nr:Yeh1 protein [Candida orthopsilosis Co 90-125]CCG22329.1 Yeh1 protein [Candida orthopsilosis Co 90-125]
MKSEGIPSRTQETKYNWFQKYTIIFISSLCSVVYSTILCTGAIIHSWYQGLEGENKLKPPDVEVRSHGYVPRVAFENIKSLKATSDLQYYLQALDLDLEEYDVTTPDGYILILHHIIDPKETKKQRDLRKPVFLQHGLLSCSGTFIASGRNSLAYYFHEQGKDVWMGNNRSWFKARHATIKGNLYNSELYWKWGMKELAYQDLPAMIETVMSMKPKHDKLTLFGHSQGGLQSFLMLSNPEFSFIHEKIDLFVPLAPAIYPGQLFYTRSFIKILVKLPKSAWTTIFGFCAMLRNLCLIRDYIAQTWLFGKLSYYMFKFLFGWTGRNWGSDVFVWHILFIFNMSYVSVELMQYYLANFASGGFVEMLQPKESYFNNDHYSADTYKSNDADMTFPYHISWFKETCKVPILVFIGDDDYLVDGKRLISHMQHYEPGYTEGQTFKHFNIPTYNHLDICWAEDVIGTIGYFVCKEWEQLERNRNGEGGEKVASSEIINE